MWKFEAHKVNQFEITTPRGVSVGFDIYAHDSAREVGEVLEELIQLANGESVEHCEDCGSRDVVHADVESIPFCESCWHKWTEETPCTPEQLAAMRS